MKKLSLTTWERVVLLQIIPPQSKTIIILRLNLRLAAILELTEEEKKQINWRREGDQWKWDQENLEWKIDFEDADYDHMIKLARQFHAWPTQRETDVLADKLGLE